MPFGVVASSGELRSSSKVRDLLDLKNGTSCNERAATTKCRNPEVSFTFHYFQNQISASWMLKQGKTFASQLLEIHQEKGC